MKFPVSEIQTYALSSQENVKYVLRVFPKLVCIGY